MPESAPHPLGRDPDADDHEFVDAMAHLMVALLPQRLPPETRAPMIREWLDTVERLLREGGAAYIPAYVQRARELYLGDAPEDDVA